MKLPVAWVMAGRTLILGCLPLAALVLAVVGCSKPTPDLVVLANPGFEQPLDSGWAQTIINDTAYSYGYIERSDTLGQPDSGFAVRVYEYMPQHATLAQTVPLETVGQVVGFAARFRFGGYKPMAPVAAVSLSYLDGSGNRLGRTLVATASARSALANSDSVHLITVADTADSVVAWRRYAVNLQTELDSWLAAVEPSAVKQLRVEMTAWVERWS